MLPASAFGSADNFYPDLKIEFILKSIPVKAIVSCLACQKGILLTSRDSGNNGPGIKNAYQCVKLIC